MKHNHFYNQKNLKLGSLFIILCSGFGCSQTNFTSKDTFSSASSVASDILQTNTDTTASNTDTTSSNTINSSTSNSSSSASANEGTSASPSSSTTATSLSCAETEPAYTPAFSSFASYDYPTGIVSSLFQDSLDNQGQEWRYSNKLSSFDGVMQFFSPEANSAYILNGKQVNLAPPKPGCRFWYASVSVKTSDQLGLAAVSKVWGGSHEWMIVKHNGLHFLWKVTTKNYALSGGHNLGHFQPSVDVGVANNYKCSGGILVKTMNTPAYNQGGCLDYAQQNKDITCVEFPNPLSSIKECKLFSGTTTGIPDQSNKVGAAWAN